MKLSLQNGFKKASRITKKNAKTFYFASRFLEKDKQQAAYSVYAICRLSDDSVDITGKLSPAIALENIKKNIEVAYSDNNLADELLLAFRETTYKYKIPKKYFDELTQGIYTDLDKNRYQNFDELYTYCYQVAGIVGLIMLKIFGYNNPAAEKYAVELGVAMQLTNILRDIKEDYKRGRIYLPKDELKQFDITERYLSHQKIDEKFIALLKFQIERARNYYENSRKGIKMIIDKKARLVTYMIKEMYADILNSIEKNNYDVFSQRAHLNIFGKINIALRILMRGQ